MSGIVSGITRSEHRAYSAPPRHDQRARFSPSEGPRETPRPAWARRPPLSALCSVVLGFRAPTRASGTPDSLRWAECAGLRVSRLSANGIPPGRLGTWRRDRIFSPARAAGARLRARGRWGRLRRVVGR